MRWIFTVILALVLMSPAQAELNWHSAGPGGGGAFESVAISTEGVVYVGSDLSGAYRSVDGGESWQVLGYRNGLLSTHVDGVAVDPERPANVMLGEDSGLYVSENCGAALDAHCQFTRKFEALVTVIRSVAKGVAYAGGVAGYCQEGALLWRSNDHGANWARVAADGLPRFANINALRVQPGNTEHIIAISAPERFTGPETCGAARWPDHTPYAAYESFDGGAHFVSLNLDGHIEDVKFDVGDPSKTWATIMPQGNDVNNNGATYLRLGRSEFKRVSASQTGQIWPLSTGGIRLLDLRRQRPWNNRPFRGDDRTGFWQWDDKAQNFTHVTSAEDYAKWDMGWSGLVHGPLGSLNGSLQSFVAASDDEAWWVDDQFVHKVSQGGKMVEDVTTRRLKDGSFATRNVDNAVGAVLAPSPADRNILYMGNFDLACMRSTQAQAAQVSWRTCNGPREALQVGQVIGNSPLNGNWQGYGGDVVAIAADPEDSKTIWAVHAPHSYVQGNAQAGFYKIAESADGNETFEDVTFNLTTLSNAAAIVALQVDAPAKGQRRLWAIAGGRLYLLDHGAKIWKAVNSNGCDGQLLVMAQQGHTKILGGSNGTCVSHDDGKTWSASKNNHSFGKPHAVWWQAFEDTPYSVSDFAFDTKNEKHIWMTLLLPSGDKNESKGGLYYSQDGGLNWAQVESFGASADKQRNFARSVAINPANSNIIVVGTSSASVAGGYQTGVPMGAFISRDGGKSWAQENTGLSWPFITQLRFAGERLFALSPGQGIVYSDLK